MRSPKLTSVLALRHWKNSTHHCVEGSTDRLRDASVPTQESERRESVADG